MKRIAASAVLAVAITVGWLLWQRPNPRPSTPASERIGVEINAISNALARQDPQTVAVIASNFARVRPAQVIDDTAAKLGPVPAGAPSPMEFTNVAPAIVLENMRRVIRQYAEVFGGNPVGTNPEITHSLTGENPKHINFLNAEAGMRVNANGELVDPWGTPFFFHQLSSRQMEVHSAGPDKILWTSDDLVLE